MSPTDSKGCRPNPKRCHPERRAGFGFHGPRSQLLSPPESAIGGYQSLCSCSLGACVQVAPRRYTARSGNHAGAIGKGNIGSKTAAVRIHRSARRAQAPCPGKEREGKKYRALGKKYRVSDVVLRCLLYGTCTWYR